MATPMTPIAEPAMSEDEFAAYVLEILAAADVNMAAKILKQLVTRHKGDGGHILGTLAHTVLLAIMADANARGNYTNAMESVNLFNVMLISGVREQTEPPHDAHH